jgi:hypothetical protein
VSSSGVHLGEADIHPKVDKEILPNLHSFGWCKRLLHSQLKVQDNKHDKQDLGGFWECAVKAVPLVVLK